MATSEKDRPQVQKKKMGEKPAILTIDVDCMHGHTESVAGRRRMRRREDRCIDLSYNLWLPRFLDILDRHKVKATFFLAADFARESCCRNTIARIVDGGHEIASHSLTHRIDLCTASIREQEAELRESRRVLEDISGARVSGFRGPGYAISRTIVNLLSAEGYLYDSSVVPGFLFPVYKNVMYWVDRILSGDAVVFPNNLSSMRRAPHIIAGRGKDALVELPINVLPLIPAPFVSYLMWNQPRFDLLYGLVRKRVRLLNYQFHDFEFMDCGSAEEFVKTAATRQICRASLKDRLSLYDEAVERILNDFNVITAQEAAMRELESEA